jgi:hypothetical protein
MEFLRKKIAALPSEEVLEEFYIVNYVSDFKDHPLFNQKYKLVELKIK